MLIKEMGGWTEWKTNPLRFDLSETLVKVFGKKIANQMGEFYLMCGFRSDIDTLFELAKNITDFSVERLRVGHTEYSPSQEVKDICKANKFDLVDGTAFDILIAGNLEGNSRKIQVAKTKNLEIFDEKSFIETYGVMPVTPKEETGSEESTTNAAKTTSLFGAWLDAHRGRL